MAANQRVNPQAAAGTVEAARNIIHTVAAATPTLFNLQDQGARPPFVAAQKSNPLYLLVSLSPAWPAVAVVWRRRLSPLFFRPRRRLILQAFLRCQAMRLQQPRGVFGQAGLVRQVKHSITAWFSRFYLGRARVSAGVP